MRATLARRRHAAVAEAAVSVGGWSEIRIEDLPLIGGQLLSMREDGLGRTLPPADETIRMGWKLV